MNYSFDFWQAQPSEHSIGSIDLFYDADSHQDPHSPHENHHPEPTALSASDQHLKIANLHLNTEPEQRQCGEEGKGLAKKAKSARNNRTQGQQKSKRRRKIKPSPYHNFQKHLNTTLRCLITFPLQASTASPAVYLANRLWSIFVQSDSSTKKILHFIFNEFNQHRLRPNELREFGFSEVYEEYSRSELAQAKTFLTEMAVGQLRDENIDAYLTTRRIKNPLKFKRYLMVFRRELQEGFLKKRFTNRSRKEQMRREMLQSTLT